MSFVLRQVERMAGAERVLHPIDLSLEPGSITTLLGPIRAGKTSLMRLMAGLDRSTGGTMLEDGREVTNLDVRRRSVSMVYQQFINYPNFTVYDNIASPLTVAGRLGKRDRDRRVRDIAERLGLSTLLQRLPAELSGGQQQRTALARAMVKDCRLLLLDEPLVNLDYKLREELREEMKSLFKDSDRIVVYATTEPQEALMLGGRTCVLNEGHKLQDGPALDVYRKPRDLRTAHLISDPAMNFFAGEVSDAESRFLQLDGGVVLPLPNDFQDLSAGRYTFGLHAAHMSLSPAVKTIELPVVIELAEINGSETLLHGLYHNEPVLLQMKGVHHATIGAAASFHFDAQNLYAFDASGGLARAPRFSPVALAATQRDGRLHGAHTIE